MGARWYTRDLKVRSQVTQYTIGVIFFPLYFIHLPYQDVLRFIRQYSSLGDFGPKVIIIGLFLYADF
jgi:hypothetical protein